MEPTGQRTIHYRRPVWPDDWKGAMTLQAALASCLNVLPNSIQTKLPAGTREASVRHRRFDKNMVFLHIASWTGGENIPTVPHVNSQLANADLAVQEPDPGTDYLDGDAFVVVYKNDYLVMPSGLRQSTVEKYLKQLLRQGKCLGASLPEGIDRFQLLSIVNRPAVEQLRQEGAKTLRLNIGDFMEDILRAGYNGSPNAIRRIGSFLWEILARSQAHRTMLQNAENMSAELLIKINGRQNGLEPVQFGSLVEPFTEEEEDSDYMEIITGKGRRIKRGKLILSKPVDVSSFAKTVRYASAWDAMKEYLGELDEMGIIERCNPE